MERNVRKVELGKDFWLREKNIVEWKKFLIKERKLIEWKMIDWINKVELIKESWW